jgi:hypothetical protein
VRKPKLGVNARGHEPLLLFVRFCGRCAGQCISRAPSRLWLSCADFSHHAIWRQMWDRPPPYFRVV